MKQLIELKAQAYDALAQIEYFQKRLQEINAQIAQVASELQNPVSGEAEEVPVEEVPAEQ